MTTSPNRVPAGVSAGGQFATGARDESEAHLPAAEPRPAAAEEWVSITDPDDPTGMPAFDGPAGQAHERLVPGRYLATNDDGDEVLVEVAEPGPDAAS